MKDYEKLIIEDLRAGYSAFNYSRFYDFVARRKDLLTYVEVGCWKGFSTVYLAKRIKKKERAKLYAVDLWAITNEMLFRWYPQYAKPEDRNNTIFAKFDKNVDPEKLIYDIYCTNINRNKVRDIVIDIRQDSSEAAKNFDEGGVDFVYIDAKHDYESVKKDISAWKGKVRRGGIISGHDYSRDSVAQAVNEQFSMPMSFRGDVWYIEAR
jgi:SAM-dependent methyltransferase